MKDIELERERRGSRRTPGQTPKDLEGKDDLAVLAKHKEAGETGPTRATASGWAADDAERLELTAA